MDKGQEEILREAVKSTKIDELTALYLEGRDKLKAIEDESKQRKAGIRQKMDLLEGEFVRRMNEQGLESLMSSAGTVYRSTIRRAKVEDFAAFFNFCKEQDAPHLLAARAADTAIVEFTESYGSLPPGVTLEAHARVNVRKK